MAWTYKQSTGKLLMPDGTLAGYGFSGNGEGLNFPPFQTQHMVGPLPQHVYKMSAWIEKHPTMGLCVIRLDPDPQDDLMFDRSGFFIHGSVSLDTAGLAAFLKSSDGCICFRDCMARRAIWASTDHALVVTG
jgi:Protein of unknown function (DUF2778)